MVRLVLTLSFVASSAMAPQQGHEHPLPERLGSVSFPISCKPAVAQEFNRAVALLHSFSYHAAEQAFHRIAQQDPGCAMAHWGGAMTHYHQLWDLPPSAADTAAAEKEIGQGKVFEGVSERELGLIHAIRLVFQDVATVPYSTRALNYEAAMHQLAVAYPGDAETQIFYALALISNASPTDREHRRQKEAAALLEPLFRAFPDHPGIPHYLIHTYDNQELAPRGLAAARVYAGIAPSAPHALHMPSHIFTRLGLWDDSIQSNLSARRAAQLDGDTGEELHAMDYLVYAYLQRGRDQEAAEVIEQLKAMQNLRMSDFKIGYAATAMPIRSMVERRRWNDAVRVIDPPDTAQPQVIAIAVWARGVGFARSSHPREAEREAEALRRIEGQLRDSGNSYWATQVDIMRREVMAWSGQAMHQSRQAVALLRSAADEEDGIEKLPLTPGPIVPAREQLGELLLQQGNLAGASKEFEQAARNSPGRRGVLEGQRQSKHLH